MLIISVEIMQILDERGRYDTSCVVMKWSGIKTVEDTNNWCQR